MSVHLQSMISPGSSDRMLDQDSNSRQKELKNTVMSSIPRNSLRVLGTLKSNTFLSFLRSICNLGRVNMCTKICKCLVKNCYLLACNQNFTCRSCGRTFRKVATCLS